MPIQRSKVINVDVFVVFDVVVVFDFLFKFEYLDRFCVDTTTDQNAASQCSKLVISSISALNPSIFFSSHTLTQLLIRTHIHVDVFIFLLFFIFCCPSLVFLMKFNILHGVFFVFFLFFPYSFFYDHSKQFFSICFCLLSKIIFRI